MVAETFGGWHPGAEREVKKLGAALARHTGQEEGEESLCLSSSRQSLVACLSIPFHLLIGNLQLPSGQSAGQGGVYHDGENIMKQSDAEILYKTMTLVMKIMLVV